MPDYWDYWSTERPTEYHVYPHGINILAKTTRFVFIRPGFLSVLTRNAVPAPCSFVQDTQERPGKLEKFCFWLTWQPGFPSPYLKHLGCPGSVHVCNFPRDVCQANEHEEGAVTFYHTLQKLQRCLRSTFKARTFCANDHLRRYRLKCQSRRPKREPERLGARP
jgi:hypothetical protein